MLSLPNRSSFYGILSGLVVFLVATFLPIWTAGFSVDRTQREWHDWSTSLWIVIWNSLAYSWRSGATLRAAIDLDDLPQFATVVVLAVLVGVGVGFFLRRIERLEDLRAPQVRKKSSPEQSAATLD